MEANTDLTPAGESKIIERKLEREAVVKMVKEVLRCRRVSVLAHRVSSRSGNTIRCPHMLSCPQEPPHGVCFTAFIYPITAVNGYVERYLGDSISFYCYCH
jgi:hypothetical protein